MTEDTHSLQGALAVALIAIGCTLFLLGLAEWIEYRAFKKWREKQRQEL